MEDSEIRAPDVDRGGKPFKNNGDENPPPPPAPVLPLALKTLLDRKNFAGEFLVKSWNLSRDNAGWRWFYSLMIKLKELDREGFLTEQLKQMELKFEVPLFIANLGKFTVNLTRMNQSNYALSSWSHIVDLYGLADGTPLQLWAFKHTESSVPGFAIAILDEAKLQELIQARQIPRDVGARIMGIRAVSSGEAAVDVLAYSRDFGAASVEEAEIVYVATKKLVKNDIRDNRGSLTIPKRDIENNDFWRDTEINRNSLHNITLIGGPIFPSVKVKLKTRPGLTISGAGWREFVKNYHLEENQQVRIWSFRKPTSSSSSNESSLGFAVDNFKKQLKDVTEEND